MELDHAGEGVVRTWPRRVCNDAFDAPMKSRKKISEKKESRILKKINGKITPKNVVDLRCRNSA